ncbi:MAG: DUF1800 domain-containing protein, partial [Bacteroidetes bacterium]|nr:DUF1800 domain-containing protein [Bacteroidota bacterium]
QDEERITTKKLFQMTPEERKEILQDLAANVKKLNLEWLKMMGKSEGQLREKMSLFWHGHFAVRVRGFAQVESYVNTIRKYALTDFGTLLMAVSKEPAMLRFLNNVQNRKNSPNENFAREVMELFTLGRGNYTEHDIKEAARAFTGWGISDEDTFELKKNQHDFGEKTIFGKTGNWEGEDVIKMILENRQTSRFITEKIYAFFVNRKLNKSRIEELSTFFYNSGYNIPELMRKIFSSDWFYDKENIASEIKSPVELIVGLNRTFGISYDNTKPLLALQRVLGQTLFFPPNVSGWAGGRNWIDNSTLVTRMNLPGILARSGGFDLQAKAMDDEAPNESPEEKSTNNFHCSFNWELFIKNFEGIPEDQLWESLCGYLLGALHIPPIPENLGVTTVMTREDRIIKMSLHLSQLPEFQLS